MIAFFKLAGVSAVLAGVFVAALEVPSAESRTTTKVHYDRVAQEPQQAEKPTRYADAGPAVTAPVVKTSAGGSADACRTQAWPYAAQGCIVSDGTPSRKPVRTITIERRDAQNNTSTLVRVTQ